MRGRRCCIHKGGEKNEGVAAHKERSWLPELEIAPRLVCISYHIDRCPGVIYRAYAI